MLLSINLAHHTNLNVLCTIRHFYSEPFSSFRLYRICSFSPHSSVFTVGNSAIRFIYVFFVFILFIPYRKFQHCWRRTCIASCGSRRFIRSGERQQKPNGHGWRCVLYSLFCILYFIVVFWYPSWMANTVLGCALMFWTYRTVLHNNKLHAWNSIIFYVIKLFFFIHLHTDTSAI